MAIRCCRVVVQGDDAYITYVYAQSVAQGHGFRFNVDGPQVLGTTTPLYTLLLAGGAKLGADIPVFSMVIGAVSMTIAAALLLLLAADLGMLLVGFVAAVAWSLSPQSWLVSEGMETGLYLALILAALWTAHRGWRTSALTLGAVCVLTRPDGLAVLVAVAVHLAVGRRWSWSAALPAGVLLGGWGAYAWLAFGSPLPTSGLAKVVHETAISGRFSLLSPTLFGLVFPLTWLALVSNADAASWLTVLALVVEWLAVGVVFVFRRRPAGRMVLLWAALYAAGYLALGVPNFGWYYAPLGLVGGLVLWAGVRHLLQVVPRRLGGVWPTVGDGVLIALGLASAGAVLVAAPPPLPAGDQVTDPHQLAGVWLHDHARPDATVVAYEVGKLRYFSDLLTIDLLGLTEPEARPFLERRDYAWAVRERPDYIFAVDPPGTWPVTAALAAEPIFGAEYVPLVRFADRPGQDYVLFGRRPT